MAEQKLILVVDDDRELVDAMRAVLERQGFKVIQAHDGHQGKQQIYNQRPDLVIGEKPLGDIEQPAHRPLVLDIDSDGSVRREREEPELGGV